jgi:glycosyltransferase involved in cell wall biosynthesis
MKIAFLGPVFPYRGGIAHYSTLLCQALRAAGHEALLVSFKRLYPRRLYPGESDRDPSQSPLVAEDAHYLIDSLNPLTWMSAFRFIHSRRPEVVVISWWTTFLAPAWFCIGGLCRLLIHRPLIFLCHNVLPHEAGLLDRIVARSVLGLGTRLIVQSDAEKQRLLAFLPGKRVDVVPHPVYDMFAGEQISREVARAQLGLSAEIPVLLFFGMIRAYKGLSDVLLALPAIRAELGEVRLLIAGEFWDDKQDYLALIERLGIGELVRIDDRYIPNENVPVYFSAADLLVAPYRTMTGSGVIQMAVGFGLPVVTTIEAPLRSGAERELVRIVDRSDLAAGTAQAVRDARAKPERPVALSAGLSGWDELVASIARDAAA